MYIKICVFSSQVLGLYSELGACQISAQSIRKKQKLELKILISLQNLATLMYKIHAPSISILIDDELIAFAQERYTIEEEQLRFMPKEESLLKAIRAYNIVSSLTCALASQQRYNLIIHQYNN